MPAPPAQEDRSEPAYDYTHSVRPDAPLAPASKWRVAIARTQDNLKMDTEFGVVEGGYAVSAGKGKEKESADVPERYVTEPPRITPSFRALLINELVASQFFEVIEREDILAIVRELRFGDSGYVSDDGPRKGRLLGVDYLINCEVDRTAAYKQGGLLGQMYGAPPADSDAAAEAPPQFQVLLRMYSVETGEMASSAMGEGYTQDDALAAAVRQLVERLPQSDVDVTLSVAQVDGDTVYIDGGRNRGLRVGMRLRVLSTDREVRNAAGEVIGQTSTSAGIVRIVQVQERMATAVVVDGDAPVSLGARLAKE